MSQVPSVLYQCFSVFAFLCLVSNQRAEATATYSLLLKERPPYRVTRDENIQTVTTIWDEDFDLADRTTSDTGPTAWTTDNAGLGTDGDNYFEVRPSGGLPEKMLVAKNTDGEVVWRSETISISGYTNIKVSADIRGDGLPTMDGHLQLYYILTDNNGVEGLETPWLNGLQRGRFEPTTAMADELNGSTLQLVIKARNTTDDDYYKIDNIRVYTESNDRYSIQDGDWNDPDTWSYTIGGPSCACVPDKLSNTHIIGDYTVDASTPLDTRNLTIHNGNQLKWINNNSLTLWGNAILDIKNGGDIEYNDFNSIKFNQWNDETFDDELDRADDVCPGGDCPEVSVIINSDDPTGFQAYELAFNAKGTYTIEGDGDVNLSDDFDINHAAQITNNLQGDINVGKHFKFHYPSIEVINHNNIIVNGNLWYRDDGSGELINHGSIVVKGKTNMNNNILTVDNRGLIEMAGQVNSAEEGEVLFYNREGATWMFGGNNVDINVRLFAHYENNTVHYNGETDQVMLTPRDINDPTKGGSYWHLILGNTVSSPGNSVKTTAGDALDINGNLEIDGVPQNKVTLDVSANHTDLNLAGDWWRHDKNATFFVAGSLTHNETVTFDGDSDQRIRTYERFISVVVDKTGDLLLEEGSSVAGVVTFKQGVVIAQNDQPLVFRPNAQAANASGISHVVGPVTKQGGADFTFPVGDGTHYCPLQLTGLTNSTTDFTVEYRAIDPTTSGYATNSVGSPLINVGQCEYWEVARTETADAEAFVTLAWDETSCPIDINDLAIVRWDGTQWVEVPGTITGDANSGSITSTSRLSAFGAFTLTEKNDAPQAVDDAAATPEGTSITISVTQNDLDRNGIDPTTVSVIASAQHGTATVDPSTGAIFYTPNTGFAGEDRLRYTVDDIKGLSSAQATVTITVQANEPAPTVVVNTKPLAQPDAFATDEDQELRGDLATNDTDSDQDALTFTLDPNFQPAHGQVAVSPNGTFTYVPDTNFFGPDQFVYQLCDDGNPSLCDTALVTVNVLSVNDAPTAAADTFTVVESDTIIANVATNDTDPEGDRLDYASLLIAPTNGSVILEPSGRFTYQPDRHYVGEDQFVYRICDSQNPPRCSEAQVVIRIQAGLLHVPRAYSPNQDQTNDVWVIPGIRAYPNNEVTVFNRWGNAVYRAKGYNNQTSVWQGEASQGMTLGNQPLPEGTYFYVIDLGEGQKPMSGYVLLKR